MTFVLDVLGRPVVVDVSDPTVDGHASRMLADLTVDTPVPDEADNVPVLGTDPALVLPSLVGTLNLAVVRYGAGSLMAHAGAVARGDGSVVLLCGGSGAGKSTLTVALLQRGCAYLTDETAVLDPFTLEVTPFRKPVSLKPGSQGLHPAHRPDWAHGTGPWTVPSGSFGTASLPPFPLEPRLLVFPRYDADAAGVQVERLTPGMAAHLVGGESSRLRDVEGGPLAALARLTRRAPAYRLCYPDADLAAEEVLGLWTT